MSNEGTHLAFGTAHSIFVRFRQCSDVGPAIVLHAIAGDHRARTIFPPPAMQEKWLIAVVQKQLKYGPELLVSRC